MDPLTTLLLYPFQPRRVARAHVRTPLWKVYIIHWLGMIALVGIAYGIDQLWSQDRGINVGLFATIATEPAAAGVAALVVAIGEAVFVVVASVMTCWAGRDEPPIETWRFTLRMSWLYVADLIWLGAACGQAVFIIEKQPGPNVLALTVIILFATSIVGSIVSYLRALTTPRNGIAAGNDVTRVECEQESYPLCERCGYNISHLDAQGQCPECRASIAASLATSRRAPLDWSHDAVAGDYLGPALHAAFMQPELFFGTLAVHVRTRYVTWLFAQRVLLSGAIGGVSFVLTVLVVEGPPPPNFWWMPLFVMLWMGLFIGWAIFMFASAVATLLGFLSWRRVRRNRFNAALLVVAATGGVLPLWTVGAAVALVLLVAVHPLLMTAWWLANGVVAVWYYRMLSRRMDLIQYANR